MASKKKIGILFTGGTICTIVKDRLRGCDEKAQYALIQSFENSDSPYASEVALCPDDFLGILSENMTTEKWNVIAESLKKMLCSGENYDGIVIAHGTDSLAYSAAMFSLLLMGTSIPVFFVASNEPIRKTDNLGWNASANGCANFRAAVECICRGITPDVYVTYRNITDGIMYLHRAVHLVQCPIYSEDFHSYDMQALDTLDLESFSHPRAPEKFSMLLLNPNLQLDSCVLKINPYVGLDYRYFDLSYHSPKAILHGTYHSGTACAEQLRPHDPYTDASILKLLDRAFERNIDVYYAPSNTDGEMYDTVPTIVHHSVNGHSVTVYCGMTEEIMYAKLVLAYSLGWDSDTRNQFLRDIAGEYIEKEI